MGGAAPEEGGSTAVLSDSAGRKGGGVIVGVGLGTPDSLLGCVSGAVGFWVAVGVNFSYS